MGHFGKFFSRIGWGIGSLAVMLVILFAVIHILKTSSLTGGTIIGAAAGWVGGHATNY